MSVNKNKMQQRFIMILAVAGGLLLLSLILNVVMLSLYSKAAKRVTHAESSVAELQAQAETLEKERDSYKAAKETAEKALEAAKQEAAPEAEEASEGGENAEAEAKPAGRYDGSNLSYTPLETDMLKEPKKAFVVVGGVDLNIRSGPGTNYSQLGTVPSGSELEVSASSFGWFLVEFDKGKYGWASGTYLFGSWMFDSNLNTALSGLTKPDKYLDKPEKISVTAQNGANARSGTSTNSLIVKRLDKGAEVIWLAESGDWRLINANGTFCWIHKANFK